MNEIYQEISKCIYCLKNIGKNRNEETHLCRTKKTILKYQHHRDLIENLIYYGRSVNYLFVNSESLFGEKIAYHHIIAICNFFNIKIPNIKEANSNSLKKLQTKETLLKKYGVDNPSKINEIKLKKSETTLKNYGVKNIFCDKEYIKKSFFKKYGVENAAHIPNRKPNKGNFSKPHLKVSSMLNELNIDHVNEKYGMFKKFNDYMQKEYSPIPDIYIPERKIVIEIYGDRWHMNPAIYKKTDVAKFFCGERTAEQVWKDDDERIKHIESFGISVLILWENDIKLLRKEDLIKGIENHETTKNKKY